MFSLTWVGAGQRRGRTLTAARSSDSTFLWRNPDVNGMSPNGHRADEHPVTPREKALKVNLDPGCYGSFAEIGAGQEVVR